MSALAFNVPLHGHCTGEGEAACPHQAISDRLVGEVLQGPMGDIDVNMAEVCRACANVRIGRYRSSGHALASGSQYSQSGRLP